MREAPTIKRACKQNKPHPGEYCRIFGIFATALIPHFPSPSPSLSILSLHVIEFYSETSLNTRNTPGGITSVHNLWRTFRYVNLFVGPMMLGKSLQSCKSKYLSSWDLTGGNDRVDTMMFYLFDSFYAA